VDRSARTHRRSPVQLRAGTTSSTGATSIRQFASLYIELYADRRAHQQSDTDLTIIEDAQTLARISGRRTVLATRDINMRVRAGVYGVEADPLLMRLCDPGLGVGWPVYPPAAELAFWANRLSPSSCRPGRNVCTNTGWGCCTSSAPRSCSARRCHSIRNATSGVTHRHS